MEFANQQKLIKKLEDHCQELKGDIEQVLSERRSYLEKQKQLIQRLDQVQNSIDDAVVEESNLSNRVESVKKGGTESGEDFLQKVCLTLGFQISKRVVKANNISRKLLYDNNCSVSFNEINQLYDLVETFPPHPEFVAIRQFLKNSQDLAFLLTTLKAYFDSSSTVKRNK